MERIRNLQSFTAIIVAMLVVTVEGQIGSPCTFSMVTSFTPCLNFITGSTNNGGSPTPGCCDSIKSIMSGNIDCMCLIITGNVPLSLPINRTLAISLPKACKGSSVPLQCKASGIPLPAPGPVLFGPTSSPLPPAGGSLAPAAASPLSPRASKASVVAPSPAETTTSEISPASPPVNEVAQPPTANPGIRPVVTIPTSASTPSSFIPSPYNLLVFMGFAMIFKNVF